MCETCRRNNINPEFESIFHGEYEYNPEMEWSDYWAKAKSYANPLFNWLSGFSSSAPRVNTSVQQAQPSPVVSTSVPASTVPTYTRWETVALEKRILYVMELLIRNYRFPLNGASGLVGNLMEESGLLPNRLEGSSAATPMRAKNFQNVVKDFSANEIMNRSYHNKTGPQLPGVGLAQWTYTSRRAGLFQHTFKGKQLGSTILFDMDAQVDYLVKEMQTKYRNVFNVISAPGITVNNASDEVVYNFETPGSVLDTNRQKLPRSDHRVQNVFVRRRKSAQHAYTVYKQVHP